jgi:hypothetical protein
MITPPRRMAPGERLTAANYNALLDYVRRITPRSGANVKVDYRLGGAVISGTPAPASPQSQPPRLFEVRQVWVSEEGSTAKVAKWCIYLPSNSLYIAQSAVDATDGLTAADGAPEGWYELPAFPDEGTSGPVYLHVTLPDDVAEDESGEETESEGDDESHEAEAEIVTEFGEQGERDVYIEIASVASDGKVLQKVVGTLVVGKDGKTGVTSLNELTGDVTIEGGDGVEVEEEGQTIRISLTGDDGDDEEDADGYCNAISGDGAGGAGGNSISGFGGGGVGGGDGIDNDISNWPCDSGVDEGETT